MYGNFLRLCFTSNQIHFAILNFCFVRHWSNLLFIKLVKLLWKKNKRPAFYTRTHTHQHRNEHFWPVFSVRRIHFDLQFCVGLYVLFVCLFVGKLGKKYIYNSTRYYSFHAFPHWEHTAHRAYFMLLAKCFYNIRFNIEMLVATTRCRLFAHKQR